MDDILIGLAVVAMVLVLAIFGAVHLIGDYRNFGDFVTQCEKQGYIQGRTVRIKCAKE